MKSSLIVAVLCGVVAAFCLPVAMTNQSVSAAEKAGPMLAHDVYFSLKDNSDQAKQALVAGCKTYLSKGPGVVWFAAGVLVNEHQREVNDQGFDVALHVVFKDKPSHDNYQEAPAHHKFIEELQDNWETVRVFDSWMNVTSHSEEMAKPDRPDEAKRPRLPDAAAFFSGMIEGKVVGKIDHGVLLSVEKIAKVWRNSKAKDPEALIGKKVPITVGKEDGRYASLVAKFLAGLELGETVALDVAHRKGETLTVLEVTAEQRKRVADD